jgi:hypothetical protein
VPFLLELTRELQRGKQIGSLSEMPENSSSQPNPEFTIAGKRIVRVQRWSHRSSVRTKLFLLFVLVTVLAWTSTSSQLFLLWKAILAFCVLFVLWPFVQATYLLYTKQSTPLRAGFEQTDSTFFDGLHESYYSPLLKMDFTLAGCLKRELNTNAVVIEIALLVHAEQEDSVQVGQVRSSLRTRHLVVFATKFDDGLVLETSNYRGTQIFKPKPKFRIFHFPQIRHIPDLYLLHKKIKEEFSARRTPMKFTPTERLNTYIEDAEEIHRLNLAQGDYKLHSSRDRYVYTLQGALRHAFLRTWPIGAIRQFAAVSESIKKARQLGYELNPKLGHAIPLRVTAPRRPSGLDPRS